MAATVFVITGTDTAVGKTVLTALWIADLRRRHIRAVALKPVASGDRSDAELLYRAQDAAVPRTLLNPWHFRAPLTPALAARRERRRVRLSQLVHHIHQVARNHDLVLVEAAGGLLSPLGDGFDTRDLIVHLRAVPVVVCPNRLGAVNQVRLVLEALPPPRRREARVVLMSPERPDPSTRSNAALISAHVASGRVTRFPRLSRNTLDTASPTPAARRALQQLGPARRRVGR